MVTVFADAEIECTTAVDQRKYQLLLKLILTLSSVETQALLVIRGKYSQVFLDCLLNREERATRYLPEASQRILGKNEKVVAKGIVTLSPLLT
jgi:hypothetical protein